MHHDRVVLDCRQDEHRACGQQGRNATAVSCSKLRSWSDCGGDIEKCYTKDEILTLITQYWVTGTIGSSMRIYNANGMIPPEQLARRVKVPSGFSIFGGDMVRPPRAWLERTANVVRVTEPEHGGHFAPFENPEQYAEELRAFFRPFREAVTG